MKNIVRAFVVVLVLTGAAASTRTASPTAKTIASLVQSNVMPIPVCDPNDSLPCQKQMGK